MILNKLEEPFSELQARKIMKDILHGMKILNENNIIHRDLKPENIFIHDDIYKIADFGFCTYFRMGGRDSTMT